MKNKTLIFGLLLVFLISFTSASLIIAPTSINIKQDVNTTKIYNFTIANSDLNNSETVNIQLTGGEILDLTNDFPKTVTAQENSTIIVFYTLNTNGKTAKNLSGIFTFYYSSQQNIPINVEILGITTTTTTTIPQQILKLNLENPPLRPGKNMVFIITNENGYPINEGTLILIMGSTSKEVQISDGIAIFIVPNDAICPGIVKVSSPGYLLLTKIYSGTNNCDSGESSSEIIGKLKFIPAGIGTSVQQFIKTQVGYWLKNTLENCAVQITGGEFTSGTTVTTKGRKPVRIENLPHDMISSGDKIFVTFTIDTDGFEADGITPLVKVGNYEPVYTVYAEDCKGNDLSAIFRFNLNVIEGIYPEANKTQYLGMEMQVNYESEIGGLVEITIEDTYGRDLADVRLKIYYPDNTIKTKYTDSKGEYEFVITQIGNYLIKADKDGYESLEYNFSIGTKQLEIETNQPYLSETLEIIIKADNLTVGNAEVRITNPSSLSKTYTTSSEGKVTYVVNETGNYEIFTNKLGHSSKTKTISISAKELTLETNDVILGGTLIAKVKSGDLLIKNAILTITYPNGTKENYTTDSAGEVTLTLNQEGSYSLLANKEGYSSASKNFNIASKILELTYEGDKILNNNLIIITKYGDIPIGNVDIEITYPDKKIEKLTTSSSGKLSLELKQNGTYSLLASKTGYSDKTDSFDVTKKTMKFSIAYYNPSNAEIGSGVYGGNMKIKILDSADNKELSDVILKTELPGGGSMSSSSVLFSMEGNYVIKASKESYEDLTQTISIAIPTTCSVGLNTKYANEQFFITCLPSKQTTVSIICGSYKDTITTNANGILNYSIASPSTCYLEYEGIISNNFEIKEKASFLSWDYIFYFGIIIIIFLVGYFIVKRKPKKKVGEYDLTREDLTETT